LRSAGAPSSFSYAIHCIWEAILCQERLYIPAFAPFRPFSLRCVAMLFSGFFRLVFCENIDIHSGLLYTFNSNLVLLCPAFAFVL
jgi:hypothetical protein